MIVPDYGSVHADYGTPAFALSSPASGHPMTHAPDPVLAPEVAGSGERPRVRAMRAEVKIIHQAIAAALPTNQQIGPWQRQAALLMALAEKHRATGSDGSVVAREAADMLEEGRLPAKVAGNSRIADTERALQSVAAVLLKALAALGAEPPRRS